jgi:hypothetical protein
VEQQIHEILLLLPIIVSALLANPGLATGICSLFVGWIPMACGVKGYSGKIYLAGTTNIALFIFTPMVAGTIEELAQTTNIGIIHTLGTTLSAGLGFVILILSAALALTPAIIAWRERLPSSARIIGLNLGSVILPILWIPALVIASLAVTKKQTAGIAHLIRQQRGNTEPASDSLQTAHIAETE